MCPTQPRNARRVDASHKGSTRRVHEVSRIHCNSERVIVLNYLRALVNTDPAKPIHMARVHRKDIRIRREVVRERLPPLILAAVTAFDFLRRAN